MTEDMFKSGEGELIQNLFGSRDENIRRLEEMTGTTISLREGNIVVEGGNEDRVDACREVLSHLMQMVKTGERITPAIVQYAIGLQKRGELDQLSGLFTEVVAKTFRGKPIRCKTVGQKAYIDAIRTHTLTFSVGPAGTGKTYLAMAMAVTALRNKEIERIVMTRPAVEAGEKLGFLPGDLNQKVDPYLRPLYDAMFEMLGSETCQRLQERGVIEVAPLAYMRGRTLSNAFIILDEAQNTTREQMKMFLTRIGFGSKVIVTGDPSQVDLPYGKTSGLDEAVLVLEGVKDIAICPLTHQDVVRHELVQAIVKAYDDHASRMKEKKSYGKEK